MQLLFDRLAKRSYSTWRRAGLVLGAVLAVIALGVGCGARPPLPKGPGPEYEDPPPAVPRESGKKSVDATDGGAS